MSSPKNDGGDITMTKLGSSGWIPYQIRTDGSVQRGYCFLSEIEHGLHQFEIEARKLLDNSPSEIKHMIYAVRYMPDKYRKEMEYRFYLAPMTEEVFEERTQSIKNARIYALHR